MMVVCSLPLRGGAVLLGGAGSGGAGSSHVVEECLEVILPTLADLDAAPTVFCSRRRPIKSILLNLALNAIKFTEKGSVTIAIRRAVSPKLKPTVELAVSDTGPGIDPEMVARAFKLYAQLSNSSIRKHRGMGLGLAVVQRNAIALGATIVVNSSLMQGSVFIVTIPISETPATRPLSFRA